MSKYIFKIVVNRKLKIKNTSAKPSLLKYTKCTLIRNQQNNLSIIHPSIHRSLSIYIFSLQYKHLDTIRHLIKMAQNTWKYRCK